MIATRTFISAGADTWVCPKGVWAVKVECWGFGGYGAHADPGGSISGSGGGGGGYSVLYAMPVVPYQTYPVFIGTTVDHLAISFDTTSCVAHGGTSGALLSGGPGATAGTGDLAVGGGDGADQFSWYGGGGGGCAGGNASLFHGGTGANGGGNGGDGVDRAAGHNGFGPGGGGAGGGTLSPGGGGAGGQILLTWPVPSSVNMIISSVSGK